MLKRNLVAPSRTIIKAKAQSAAVITTFGTVFVIQTEEPKAPPPPTGPSIWDWFFAMNNLYLWLVVGVLSAIILFCCCFLAWRKRTRLEREEMAQFKTGRRLSRKPSAGFALDGAPIVVSAKNPSQYQLNNGPTENKMLTRNKSMNRAASSLSRGNNSRSNHTLDGAGTVLFTESEGNNYQQILSLPGYLELAFGFDYRISRHLSEGGSGVIALAEILKQPLYEEFGNICVAKTIKLPSSGRTAKLEKAFQQEVAMMHFFSKYPYFAVLIGFTSNPFVILMKYYASGSMYDWIHKNAMNDRCKYFILLLFKDLCNAIKVMHNFGFIHRDIKPANCLIEYQDDGRPHSLLTDFGLTMIADQTVSVVQGFRAVQLNGASILYAAPEIISDLKAKRENDELGMAETQSRNPRQWKKVDIFSLASTLYECLNIEQPWKKQVRADLMMETPVTKKFAKAGYNGNMQQPQPSISLNRRATEAQQPYQNARATPQPLYAPGYSGNMGSNMGSYQNFGAANDGANYGMRIAQQPNESGYDPSVNNYGAESQSYGNSYDANQSYMQPQSYQNSYDPNAESPLGMQQPDFRGSYLGPSGYYNDQLYGQEYTRTAMSGGVTDDGQSYQQNVYSPPETVSTNQRNMLQPPANQGYAGPQTVSQPRRVASANRPQQQQQQPPYSNQNNYQQW